MTTSSLAALGLTAQAGRNAQITGLSVDSRKVVEGHLFAALPGSIAHGADFIPAALANGATAILTDAEGAAIAAPTLADSQATPRQSLSRYTMSWRKRLRTTSPTSRWRHRATG